MGTGFGVALQQLSADQVLWGSGGIALLLVLARVPGLPARLDAILYGKGRFDPKASWVSNTTLLSAVLIGALKDGYVGKEVMKDSTAWLGGLYLIFATLAVVAMLIYLVSLANDKGQSRVWIFLVSAFVAQWAAIGQLVTLMRATMVGAKGGYLTPGGTHFFLALVALVLVAVLVYAWKSIYLQIDAYKTQPPKSAAENLPDAAPRRPAEWPLL